MCCPFYNEHLVARINIEEASKWVDEIHITEFDKSFKYTEHPYEFDVDGDKVHYHPMTGLFLKPRKYIPHITLKPISRWMKKYVRYTAWYNEGISRNNALWNSNYKDDDILILSDIDEIIGSRYKDEILAAVEKYDIVTIKVYFTNFYFNLFCPKFGGPADYSYRVFILKGKTMRERFYNDSDYLRKMGENFKLMDSVKCLEGFKGFHHSWLGDEEFVVNKLKSYAHTLDCQSDKIMTNGEVDIVKVKKHLIAGESIFEGSPLVVDNSVRMLPSVEKLRKTDPRYFI